MDFCRNVSVSGDYQQPEQVFSPPLSTALDDLFSGQNTEVDVSLEWLSIFVEDCLSSKGNCLPPPTNVQTQKPQNQNPKNPSSLHKFIVPGKARTKRKRTTTKPKTKTPLTSWSHNPPFLTTSDPPLLNQAYWLADSELIVAKQDEPTKEKLHHEDENKVMEEQDKGQGQPRRCSHCLSQRTPQWRAGPLGPKTLCNACGVRYKSGRLLPEYRPAKSPTFVSYLHSNSHKKVMEMRMNVVSSISSD